MVRTNRIGRATIAERAIGLDPATGATGEPGGGLLPRRRRAGRARRRRRIGRLPARMVLSAGFVGAFVLVAVVVPVIADFDFVTTHTGERLLPPGSVLESRPRAWLGTDQVGRDLLAQVIEGARISILVGAVTVLVAAFAGTVLGLLSGYFGGWLDSLVMRLADIQLAFPPILLAIFIAAVLGPSVLNVIITLAVTRWVVFARVARASTLPLKRREYVDAAKVLGAGRLRIIGREILPAIITPLVVVATVEFGLVVIAEASLSFLGLGTPQDLPSWGLTIADGRDYLDQAWWIATFPGLALASLMLAVGTFSDELRDYLDPRLRGSR